MFGIRQKYILNNFNKKVANVRRQQEAKAANANPAVVKGIAGQKRKQPEQNPPVVSNVTNDFKSSDGYRARELLSNKDNPYKLNIY